MSFVKFKDAFKAGFSVTPVNFSNLTNVSNQDKDHVRLEKNLISYENMYKSCLVTVNGFFHICDTDKVNGVMVIDAMKTLNKSKQNQIGIHSFKDVCSIKTKPIKEEMLTTYSDGTVRLTINEDLTNKTILLSIGGYLTFQNSLNFFPINDNIFKLDFNNMNILNKFYESKRYLNLDSLPVEFSVNNTNQISLAQFLGDVNLKEYLKLSQSFIIILDTPSIVVSKKHIRKSGLPGMYISYVNPIYPLMTNLGRFPEYWVTKEDVHYSVTIYDNVVENRIFDTFAKEQIVSVDDSRRPWYPDYYSDASFMVISKP